ncbi:MAG: hypothetical protein NMNS01_18960 [Nitrosomonas sp.]|jgi:hypothetical protein|nr:MAG: hypothetical protein NMNS01_18960 [Nitrosomonas sp.]
MDEETKKLLANIAHHLKWVIVLLFAILAMLLAEKAWAATESCYTSLAADVSHILL